MNPTKRPPHLVYLGRMSTVGNRKVYRLPSGIVAGWNPRDEMFYPYPVEAVRRTKASPPEVEPERQVVARWESSSGRWTVELIKVKGLGFKYEADSAGGWLAANTVESAVAELERRIGDFQPDANRRPMRRVL